MRAILIVAIVTLFCGVFGDDCPQEECDASQTCCKGPISGMYGCCPSPNAVCCTDGFHCCPTNTVCNLDAGTCDQPANLLIPFVFRKQMIKTPVEKPVEIPKALELREAKKVGIIYCPGGVYTCQDNTTCCPLPPPSTGYGCCPYPNAVCCADDRHCCPAGTHCDSTSTWCLQGNDKFRALFKRPAVPTM